MVAPNNKFLAAEKARRQADRLDLYVAVFVAVWLVIWMAVLSGAAVWLWTHA